MAFGVRIALRPAGAWRGGSVACALIGLLGTGLWVWSWLPLDANPGSPALLLWLGILVLGAHSVSRARRARLPQDSLLHIDPLGRAHLMGQNGAEPLVPLNGHRNALLLALERADRPRGDAGRWLSVRQPRSDSDRAALGAWLVWRSRGSR
jgi:hypothetical protein